MSTRTALPQFWITCMDGLDHVVRDDDAAQCASGLYLLLCGAHRLPAPSTNVPRPRCPLCTQVEATMARMAAARTAGTRRAPWWLRLCKRSGS